MMSFGEKSWTLVKFSRGAQTSGIGKNRRVLLLVVTYV